MEVDERSISASDTLGHVCSVCDVPFDQKRQVLNDLHPPTRVD